MENSNKYGITSAISVINFNINGLNAPVKRQRLSEWIKKQDPMISNLQESHFKYKDMQIKGKEKNILC